MTQNRKIRVGSRDSKLAVIQSNIIIEQIKRHHPDIEVELITMKTTGDKILNTTLDKVGGKGLFVKELDRALLDKEVDITVHSLKDVPMELDERIPLVAYTKCESPSDVLVLPEGITELNYEKPIGCASKRRALQLQKLYPQATVAPVRGNVQTRLRKLDEGQYSALILAEAGLKRLDLHSRISRIFTPDEMIPAAGQGVIVVQGRAGEDFSYLDEINDEEARRKVEAERAFVSALEGGCSSPVAAYATMDGDMMTITGLYATEDAMSMEEVKIDSITGNKMSHQLLGRTLAEKIKEK